MGEGAEARRPLAGCRESPRRRDPEMTQGLVKRGGKVTDTRKTPQTTPGLVSHRPQSSLVPPPPGGHMPPEQCDTPQGAAVGWGPQPLASMLSSQGGDGPDWKATHDHRCFQDNLWVASQRTHPGIHWG